jgi:3-methyladenine DNA glycosylase AlkC
VFCDSAKVFYNSLDYKKNNKSGTDLMSENQALKLYYNPELAQSIGERVRRVYPPFDTAAFVAEIAAEVDKLEFKDRIVLFSSALHRQLPPAFPEAWAVLEQLLGGELVEEEGMFSEGFALWPLAQFIEMYGLDDFDVAVGAMYEITKRHTAEFAIRPFLRRYPERTLAVLRKWVEDESPHVRRLVSEGTRPRLPWAGRLDAFMADPRPTLALLEGLKDDPSAFVRKSVANHLNDISKDHPQLVIDTLIRWREDAGQERMWIIRHALRTLVKKGDPVALALLGFGPPQVSLDDMRVEPDHIRFGESLVFSFTLQSESDEAQNLIIDYVIHFVKASGQTSPKVFKLSTRELSGRESVRVRKKHTIRPITTRRHYPGEHRIEIQVNGQVLGGQRFGLEMPA